MFVLVVDEFIRIYRESVTTEQDLLVYQDQIPKKQYDP